MKNIAKYLVIVALLAAPTAARAQAEAVDLFRLGAQQLAAGMIDKAIEAFEKGVQLKPDVKEGWYNLGVAYGRKKLYTKEIASYSKALELDPNYVNALHNLGLAYVDLAQKDKALDVLQKAAKADPKDKMLQLQIQDVAKERLAYELEEFHERVVHYPTEMLFQYEYGLRLFKTKRFDDAIGALQIAQNNPKVRADALYYLGQAFFEKGLMSEAIDTLKRSKDSYELAETGDAKSKNIYYSLGRALQTAGNIDEAVAIYSKIMQWDYGFLDVRTRLEALRKKPE